MKQRVALTAALAGLVVGFQLASAAGAGGPSLDPAIWDEHRGLPLLCLDDQTGSDGVDCRPVMLNDLDDPPVIDLRPAHVETVDA